MGLSTIDHCGDHRLECMHGPMRIRQHDALFEIIYHARCLRVTLVYVRSNTILVMINLDQGMFTIQTSNTVVLLILTYQYVLLPRLSIFFPHLLHLGSCYCWELAKDQQHQNTVEDAGCDFIPLMVGVWSPCLSISLRTTPQLEVALPLDQREETCCNNYQCHFGLIIEALGFTRWGH